MGADNNSSLRRWKLQQDELASNTRLRLTTQVDQLHAATGVLLKLGTNSQPHRPENAAEHQNSSPLTNIGQTGPCW
jgi:hypothetical protein